MKRVIGSWTAYLDNLPPENETQQRIDQPEHTTQPQSHKGPSQSVLVKLFATVLAGSILVPRAHDPSGLRQESKDVFHLPRLPRDSGNSGWDVNGTWFFGLFHWKISGKSGTSEKVVPFSRWKFSDGNLCSIYGFRKGLPVPGRSQPLFFIPSGNMAGNMAATSSASPSAFYECSVCHGLAPDLETLLHHNCAMYANSPANGK